MSVKPPSHRIETSSPPGLFCQILLGSLTWILVRVQLLTAHSGTAGIAGPFCARSPLQNLAGPSESTVTSTGPADASGITRKPIAIVRANVAAAASGLGHRRRRCDRGEFMTLSLRIIHASKI